MGKKLISLIGIGAGMYLVRKEIRKNPDGPVAKTLNAVTGNPTVQKAAQATKDKAAQVIQQQGEAVTDKVADAVKERLFGATPKNQQPDPVYVEVEVEEVQTPGQAR